MRNLPGYFMKDSVLMKIRTNAAEARGVTSQNCQGGAVDIRSAVPYERKVPNRMGRDISVILILFSRPVLFRREQSPLLL